MLDIIEARHLLKLHADWQRQIPVKQQNQLKERKIELLYKCIFFFLPSFFLVLLKGK